jgi:hypothetical protein
MIMLRKSSYHGCHAAAIIFYCSLTFVPSLHVCACAAAAAAAGDGDELTFSCFLKINSHSHASAL